MNENSRSFTLSQDDFETLLFSLGIAIGACFRDGNRKGAHSITRLANTINKDNPGWTPYETDPDSTAAGLQQLENLSPQDNGGLSK